MKPALKDFNTYLNGIDYEYWKRLCVIHGVKRLLHKGEHFLRQGKVARLVGFIAKGSVKYVVYNSAGVECVIGLETQGGFAASFPYCFENRPSAVSIIATADTEMQCIAVSDIEELAANDPHVRKLLDETLRMVFYDIYNRYSSLYALTPAERYAQLLHRCPQLFENFMQKDIASYLNITPQHLRRIRDEQQKY